SWTKRLMQIAASDAVAADGCPRLHGPNGGQIGYRRAGRKIAPTQSAARQIAPPCKARSTESQAPRYGLAAAKPRIRAVFARAACASHAVLAGAACGDRKAMPRGAAANLGPSSNATRATAVRGTRNCAEAASPQA